jgi:hypothetical protein
MSRKIVAVAALAAFSLFEMSCIPISVGKGSASGGAVSPSELGPKAAEAKIVHVVLKSGQNIAFGEKQPGRVAPGGDAVVGITHQMREFSENEIKRASQSADGKIVEIETHNGAVYKVLASKVTDGRTLYSIYGPITIPFSDIQQVWVKRRAKGSSIAVIAGVVCLAGALVLALASHPHQDSKWPPDDSCPFVYSWNGEEYVLDAEPFGAAISEGLKRTDWIEMSNLRPVGGEYRLLLSNELEETQYTDELKLVAVDHAPGLTVAPDIEGRVHTFERPLAPVRAVDGKGRDILPFVASDDRAFWLSPLEEKALDGTGDFRDELVFEFAKPAGAKMVKLLANAWSTKWGSYSAGRFLELFGSSLDDVYRDIDRHGPTYFHLNAWLAGEEIGRLKIWVETPGGWKDRGAILGGSPVVTKNKVYVLDIADVPGTRLRIKLRPPVNFWMVNALSVDYADDAPVRITELAAATAVDRNGRNVAAALESNDGVYLENPSAEDRTAIVFAALPLEKGLERTVLLKAAGYYRIHTEAGGEPQAELLARILGERGFAARYSFREYLKWEAALRAEAQAAPAKR